MKRRRSGQSVIEFVIISLTFFTFFFILVKSALNLAQGHYVHYATFMAARAYMAGNTDQAAQKSAADRTLAAYLGEEGTRYGIHPDTDADGNGAVASSNVGTGDVFNAGNPATRWQEGVTFAFKQRMYVLPLISAVSSRGNAGQVKLTSESWLGREVSSKECMDFMTGSHDGGHHWLVDNGC
jgi:Flp pilus assembly protein TadG